VNEIDIVVVGHSVNGVPLPVPDLRNWVKTNAGQGSLYRSAHELIGFIALVKPATKITYSLDDSGATEQMFGRMPA
jgi:hypothetical protein